EDGIRDRTVTGVQTCALPISKFHVIASMQPYHAIDDGRWAEARLGHERTRYSYAWRSFLDHGVTLAFGTDWPVAPLDPMLGVYRSEERRVGKECRCGCGAD